MSLKTYIMQSTIVEIECTDNTVIGTTVGVGGSSNGGVKYNIGTGLKFNARITFTDSTRTIAI